MSLSALSLIMNVLIMALLGVMIFHSRRLSKSIEIFRNSRKEMETLIRDLSTHIDKANTAIKKMRRESAESADGLYDMTTKARALSDELQYIHEAGDRLAERLEKGIEKNSGKFKDPYEDIEDQVEIESVAKPARKKAASKTKPMFNIVDREYEDEQDERDESIPSFLTDPEHEDLGVPNEFQSEAEKELAAALKSRRSGRK